MFVIKYQKKTNNNKNSNASGVKRRFSVYFSGFFFSFHLIASPSTICSGLKAQTWSPWSPHHHSMFNKIKTGSNINISTTNSTTTNNNNNCTSLMNLHNNWTTPTQPIRRGSMTSSKSVDGNCAFPSAKRPFVRTNTFSSGLSSFLARANELNVLRKMDEMSTSTSSVEKSSSFENISTQSNPSF